jgi:hypothetical protein
MRCISPINLKDPRRKSAAQRIQVPCGKCGSCRYNRRIGWSFRLAQELKVSTSAYFITLTYDNENIKYSNSGAPTLCKEDLQKFIKRARKEQCKYTTAKIRHYSVGEYGSKTGRPHYHTILFNLDPNTRNKLVKRWPFGGIHIGSVNGASIHYITKYHVNYRTMSDLTEDDPINEFAMMSKKPGIGSCYIDRTKEYHQDGGNTFVMNNGYAQQMPRYYRDKIFSEFEREILAQSAMSEHEKNYFKEFNRLMELGIENPDEYMQTSAYLDSLKVDHKSNEQDMF